MESVTRTPNEPERAWLEALNGLSQIGAVASRVEPGDMQAAAAALHLIAQRVVQAIPGAAALIYAYDPARHTLGERFAPLTGREPQMDELALDALRQRRTALASAEGEPQESVGTAACFPLSAGGQDVGALCVDLGQARPFSQAELLILENLGYHAATALYQGHRPDAAVRSAARSSDELNRLRRAGLLISSRLSLEETLKAILQMALEVIDAHYGIFRLVDSENQVLVTRAIAGEELARPLVEALPIDTRSVMGWVAMHREPVLIHDLHQEPWVHVYHPLDANLEMRSELAVPLIDASGRLEGVLNLESPIAGAFSEQDSLLLQSMATQAVIAIQEVRLLDALQEVAQRLLTQPCDQVLNRLVDLACDLLNAAASAIWTLHGDRLILQTASAGYERGDILPLHGSLTGQAILERGPVTTGDVRKDPRFHRSDLARTQSWTRALVVPVLASDDREPIGAFSVYSAGSSPGRFAESEWDAKVLVCLAHYAALALHNDERRRALHEAQERHAVAETFAAVGDIAANLLHQLNNKVGTIPVRVQGIQDKSKPALLADPYLATNLHEIERSAQEAMEAVRENLSHLHPIHLAPVNVAACVAAATQGADLPPGVVVRAHGMEDWPAVAAGKRSLTLVFTNLLDNAATAMDGQGTIDIRGTAYADRIEIAVSDSGPGIAPELHDRIFEFNFSGRGGRKEGKLGFGLWWVKTLMVRLGGTVAVESDGRHGTTFRLTLPVAEKTA